MDCAYPSHNEWTDQSRHDAQLHLGESELRVFSCDADIACGHEAGSSPQRRPMDSSDDRLRAPDDRQEHFYSSLGIAPILIGSELCNTFRPVQIRAGAEGLSISLEHNG